MQGTSDEHLKERSDDYTYRSDNQKPCNTTLCYPGILPPPPEANVNRLVFISSITAFWEYATV